MTASAAAAMAAPANEIDASALAPMLVQAQPVAAHLVGANDVPASGGAGTEVVDAMASRDARAVEGHLVQIWAALSSDERTRAEALLRQLTEEQRAVWAVELMSLTVPETIERVRSALRMTAQGPNQPA